MRSIFVSVCVVVIVIVAVASATPVKQCTNGIEPIPGDVNVTRCDKPPCKLKRKSDVGVVMRFKATEDVPTVKNNVNAMILGIPFPFIGVDGTSVCGKLFLEDDTKAGCPLKAGQTYLYKDSFNVLELYPKIKTLVHWSLRGSNGKDVFCMEVPVRIVS